MIHLTFLLGMGLILTAPLRGGWLQVLVGVGVVVLPWL